MDKNLAPVVSVVMSVLNGENYLEVAVKSILNQTFRNFEFIIINDGSSDSTGEILHKFKDNRLKILDQTNKGLVASLNRGILEARGKYIARMDADDASEPKRLEKQIEAFKSDKSLVLVGSSMKVMDEFGKILHTHHVLIDNPELKQELLIRSPFAHGSTIFRRDLAVKAGLYNQTYFPAEDYDLWLRLAEFGSFRNVNEPLYIYRENSQGISSKNQSIQERQAEKVRRKAWKIRRTLVAETSNVNLTGYSKLDHGSLRINRIRENLNSCIVKSIKKGDLGFATRMYQLKNKLDFNGNQ